MRIAARVGLAPLAVAAGFDSGVGAIAFYSEPWGWWLAVIGVSAALVALTGWLRIGFAVGWLTILGLALVGRPEGDWAISKGVSGYGLLAVALLHLGFVVATIPVRRPAPAPPTT